MITEVATDTASDTQALAEALAEGRKPDTELVIRVRARAELARRELIAARGIQDMGVQLIREIRGDLPDS